MSRRTRASNGRSWDDRPGEGGRSAFFGGIVKLCVVVAVLALVAMGGILLMPLVEAQRQLDLEVDALAAERDEVALARDRARAKLDWISHDAEYIEMVARDELDRFKPGEVVFRIDRAEENNR